ncbi:MAG: sensor histidine kinase [Nitrospirota bacterium]
MKIPFSQKLATRLSIIPLLIIFLLLIACGAGFYYLAPHYLFRDAHRLYLISAAAGKKQTIDMWFEQSKRQIDYLSRSTDLRAGAAIMTGAVQGRNVPDHMKKNISVKTSRILEEMVPSSNFRMFALLSMSGKVMASSQQELLGGDWSDRDFFEHRVTAELKSPAVAGFHSYGNPDGGLVFLAPVNDEKGRTVALLYAVSGLDKLSGLLQSEHKLYKTEKTELIDSEGTLILTAHGIPDKRLRYNLSRETSHEQQVRAKDRFFYYVTSLEHAPFRLISTVVRDEVMQPITTLLIICAAVAGVVLVSMIVLGAYIAPRRITRPVGKLVSAARSVAAGSSDIDLGRGFTGELLELKKAFEAMIEALGEQRSGRRIGSYGRAGMDAGLYAGVSHEVTATLNHISACAEAMLRGEPNGTEVSRRVLQNILESAQDLQLLMESVFDISKLESGERVATPMEFNLCDLLKEVEEYGRKRLGTKEITLLFDCSDGFAARPVYADRQRLKQILESLVGNALKTTHIGTITLLSTESVKDGIESIEISVADTGAGIEEERLERLFEDISSLSLSLRLAIAKKLVDILGGTITAESEAGKGSVFTVTIPTKTRVY